MVGALLFLVGQEPQSDPALWPYFVAIGSLASACVAMFGIIVKQSRDFEAKLEKVHTDHRLANEARSERVSAEFKVKDDALLAVSVAQAEVIGKVGNELRRINDQRQLTAPTQPRGLLSPGGDRD